MTTFRTVLEPTSGNNVGIVVPEDVVLSFNRGKRVPVVVTIDGGYTYKTTPALSPSQRGPSRPRLPAWAGSWCRATRGPICP